jgi:hypothetical protein
MFGQAKSALGKLLLATAALTGNNETHGQDGPTYDSGMDKAEGALVVPDLKLDLGEPQVITDLRQLPENLHAITFSGSLPYLKPFREISGVAWRDTTLGFDGEKENKTRYAGASLDRNATVIYLRYYNATRDTVNFLNESNAITEWSQAGYKLLSDGDQAYLIGNGQRIPLIVAQTGSHTILAPYVPHVANTRIDLNLNKHGGSTEKR